MGLPVPDLDDRTFQDIVNEAKRKIPLYCPEWTDHNLSDPGITLIELFSWMTEMTLYRLNQVPDKNYVKFLELIGVELAPAAPAGTEITFRLSGAQPNKVTMPAGTEVATVRTETDEAILFTTVEDTTISPATLAHLLVSEDGESFVDRLALLTDWRALLGTPGQEGRVTNLFADTPAPGNAFYIGIEADIRRTVINLNLECAERAAPGIVPTNPPLRWEYWDSELQDWAAFERNQDEEAWIEQDGTRG
ncbi:MAG: putative baseplate assembly protein, partial [Chloroflexi bacterium]|nr:putative baseplate assembly protein [Chloroflexota bacterium]